MSIPTKSQEELLELSKSYTFRKDMEIISSKRHNPFIKNGKCDADAYLEFVTQYNEFINHEQKPFKEMVDRDMRL